MNTGVHTIYPPESQFSDQHEAHQTRCGLPVALHVASDLGLWLQKPRPWPNGMVPPEPLKPHICSEVLGSDWMRMGSRAPAGHFSFGDHEVKNPRNNPILSQPHSPVQACSRGWALFASGWKLLNPPQLTWRGQVHQLGVRSCCGHFTDVVPAPQSAHPHTLLIPTY